MRMLLSSYTFADVEMDKLNLKKILHEIFSGGDYKFVVQEAIYRGKKVKLGRPFRLKSNKSKKKFGIYIKDKKTGKVKLVKFGYKGMKIKNYDEKRARSFQKRHNCKDAKYGTPKYFSCNIHRYADILNLKSKRKW